MKLSGNTSENKKWQRILVAACIIIILLGLGFLFWGVWNGCATGTCGSGHSVANLYFIPAGTWNGFSPGTCGPDTVPMTITNNVQPTFEQSYLYKFGEQEPDRNITLPSLQRYPEQKLLIDTLMNLTQINGSPDSIIGLYEFPGARLLLIDRDTNVSEVLGTGDLVRTFSLAPVMVGTFHYESLPDGNLKRGAYNFSYENSVTITRVDIILPPPATVTVPLYIVNKTEREQVFYPDGRSLASITTTGRFYVLYGQRVERVTGTSAILLDPAWKQCSPRVEIAGEGSRVGETKYTNKFARSSERLLWLHRISTSDQIQVFDTAMGGTSSSQWKSTDSTGCTC